MELSQLRSLVALANTRNFRRSAALQHISQPSLSEQIRRLESELGIQLVDRKRRPVELTEAGKLLTARAERLLRQLDEAITEVRDSAAGVAGSLSIGAMQYLALLELPSVLANFRKRYDRVNLHLRVGNTGDVRTLLLDREIQIGLFHADSDPLPSNFVEKALRTEELVVVLALHDPRLAAGHLSWPDIADTPFVTFRAGASIGTALRDAAATAGFTPRISVESTDMSAALALVEQGLGAALIPRSLALSARDRVGHVTIGDRTVTRTLEVAWDRDQYQTRAMRAFVAAAEDAFT